MALNPRNEEKVLHLIVDSWEKNDVLGRVLEHLLAQGPHCMPESLVILHLLRYSLLIGVLNIGAQVLLKESVEADLVLVASVAETLRRRRDYTVRNLSVKDAVAVHTILIDKSRAVLTEVVEDLDDMPARQNLLEVVGEAVIEGIHT